MGVRKHLVPIVCCLFFLLIAREIYPYVEPFNSEVADGFSIEKIDSGYGGPTCLEWADNTSLLMCDRDSGRILLLDAEEDFSPTTLLTDLDHPHDIHLTTEHLFVSEEGKLTRYNRSNFSFVIRML